MNPPMSDPKTALRHPFAPCEWKLAGMTHMLEYCEHPDYCHFGRERPGGICDLPLSDSVHDTAGMGEKGQE